MKHSYLALFLLLGFAYSCASVRSTADLLVTDDLAAALNALPSGAKVKLAPRQYLLAEAVLLDGKENITIDGNGATLIMNSLESDVLHLTGCTNIQLLNFKATHIEASGPIGCTGNVIYIDESSDVLIEGCDLNGSGIVGIAAYNTDNLRVRNNHIHKNSEYAIIYQGPSLLLANNTFDKNGHGNVIYYSYAEKDGLLNWPPDQELTTDTQGPGLVMRGNSFK